MTEGFKIGGVGGHPVAHGNSCVSPPLIISTDNEGYGWYTNYNPLDSVQFCSAFQSDSQIIALRCLPGRNGDSSVAVGSPTRTLVLRSSE